MKCSVCVTPMQPTRPPKTQGSSCSYWCALVERGTPGFTLATITPWLIDNRKYKPAPGLEQATFDLEAIA